VIQNYLNTKYPHLTVWETTQGCYNGYFSGICFNLNQLPLRYRTLGDEKCGDNSSDGCLYFEIRELIEENNLKSVLINKITCTVEGDGYFKNN
jgi:hypothetical protein